QPDHPGKTRPGAGRLKTLIPQPTTFTSLNLDLTKVIWPHGGRLSGAAGGPLRCVRLLDGAPWGTRPCHCLAWHDLEKKSSTFLLKSSAWSINVECPEHGTTHSAPCGMFWKIWTVCSM